MFAAALAVVLGDYPTKIVEYAADPRTGVITAFPMGLPNIGQIRGFLDDTQERQDRLARLAALPKPTRFTGRPIDRSPNLFVPSTDRYYEKLCKDHQETGGEFSHFVEGHLCTDGVRRNGIMVPLPWRDEPQKTAAETIAEAGRRVFVNECREAGIDPHRGVSPALLKTINDKTKVA